MWKKSLLLLLLLSLSSVGLFSEVILTDEEYNEIMTLLDESEKELKMQVIQIERLQSILTTLKEQQKISNNIINQLSIEYERLKENSGEPLIETIKNMVLAALAGFATGYVIADYK